MKFLLLIVMLLWTTLAQAMTYYISPSGNNGNDGLSDSAPKLTFAHVLPLLNAGDTLNLLDGTYTAANSGFPDISCTSTHDNGTSENPIIMQAVNERVPVLKQDGSAPALKIDNCAYWQFAGLRVESADKFGVTIENSNIYAVNSDHLTFTRMLVYDNNRVNNSHLLHFNDTTDSLVEESEFYKFHRHAIINWNLSTNNTIRRVYCNSRGEADLAGAGPGNNGITPYRSTDPLNGDICVTNYAGSSNLMENLISEGNQAVVDIQARNTNTGHRVLGSISLNERYGVIFGARGSTTALMPTNALAENVVVINAVHWPYFRGNKNTTLRNMTVTQNGSGMVFDFEPGVPGDGVYSITTENVLAFNNDGYGIRTVDQDSWLHDYVNAFGNGVNLSASGGSGSHTNSSTIDPVMGTCYVFIPDDSPMKAAGKSGADIGANVLYAYEDGTLTSTELWDTTTGAWLHGGAIIAGINDTIDSSLYNVHQRLHVSYAGCVLPATYTSPEDPTDPTDGELSLDTNTLSWTMTDETGITHYRIYMGCEPITNNSPYFSLPKTDAIIKKDGTGTYNDLTNAYIVPRLGGEVCDDVEVSVRPISSGVEGAFTNEITWTRP